MSKEIIVNKGKQTRIAIVEDGELAELFIENQEHERTIGNIFLGRIRRVMPSIQAAFVDIGQKQDAFLHFSDLIDNVESWLDYVKTDQAEIGSFKGDYTTKPAGKKRRRPSGQRHGGKGGRHQHVADEKSANRRKSAHGRQHGSRDSRDRGGDDQEQQRFDPAQILGKDVPILVKISKEPIANKGSRISTDISLAGRFLVLVPMANYVAVSKKIMSFKERRRLRALARSLLPEGFGVIVRTVAEGRSAKALDTDLNLLVDKWKKIESKLKTNPKPPVGIHEDVNMVSSIMRDLFTEDYDRILIDDQKLYRNIRGYVQAIAPDMVDDVKLETDAESIFQKVGIKDSVEEAFDDRVNMPSGGYLFIEQTEAMHVVDVNSGRAGRGMSQEDSSLKVNLEAARIICKQVRLRDLGGIIVVDFIDMRHESNKRKLYETLKKEFRADRAVTKVLPMSDFGLVQITRQRLRPSITTTFSLPDDQSGDAKSESRPRKKEVRDRLVEPSHLRVEPEDLLEKIEEWLSAYRDAGKSARVRLKVHPFTASFLSGKFPSRTFRWRLRFGVRVQIDAEPTVDPMSFRFFDGASGKEISRLPSKKDRDARSKSASANKSGDKRREGAKAEAVKAEAPKAEEGKNDSSGRSGSRSSGSGRSDNRGRSGGRGRSDNRRGSENRGGSDNRRRSDGRGRSDSRSESDSQSGSDNRSGTENRGKSDNRSGSDNRGRSDTRGSSDSRRNSDGRGSSDSTGRSDSRGNSDNRGRSDNRRRSDSQDASDNRGRSDNRRRSDSQDASDNRGRSDNRRRSDSQDASDNRGRSDDRRRSDSQDASDNRGRSDDRRRADSQDASDNRGRSDDRRRSDSQDASDNRRRSDDRRRADSQDDKSGESRSSNRGRSQKQDQSGSQENQNRNDRSQDSRDSGGRNDNRRDEKPRDDQKKDNRGSKVQADTRQDDQSDKGGKQAPPKTQEAKKASDDKPTSNRFMKIDLRSE